MESTLSTLIGVFVGFAISATDRWWRERGADQQLAKSVRMLLHLETEQNMTLVRDWHANIVQAVENEGGDPDFADIDGARSLIQSELPPWSHQVFNSQLTALPRALTPNQIESLYQHHKSLDILASIRSTLCQLNEEQQAEYRARRGGTVVEIRMPASVFQSNAGVLWSKFLKVVVELEKVGNPVKQSDPGER